MYWIMIYLESSIVTPQNSKQTFQMSLYHNHYGYVHIHTVSTCNITEFYFTEVTKLIIKQIYIIQK